MDMHEHIFAKYNCCDSPDWGSPNSTDHGLILAQSDSVCDSDSDTPAEENIRQRMVHCSMPRMLWRVELEEMNPNDIQAVQAPIVFGHDERPNPMSLRSLNPIVSSGAVRFFADSRKFLSTIMLISMPDCGEDTT